MVLSFLSLKGGQGKTTLAINMAEELMAKGFNVALVDADNQESLSDFFFHKNDEKFKCFKFESKEELQKLSTIYDAVIIDNSPRINTILNEVLSVTDFVIIPTKLDIYSYWTNSELIKILKGFNLDFAFLFNCVKHYQTKLKNEFEESLSQLGVKVFKQKISESNDYLKALNELKTLREINSKKVAEIQLVIKELEEM